MKIAVETFTLELAAEITPLGQECWDECSKIKQETCAFHGQRGLQIDPNNDVYLMMQQNGSLIALTLRDDEGSLRGYALILTYYSMHLRKELCGNVDTFYVQPDYRSSMLRMISAVRESCEAYGVSVVGWPVSMGGLLYEILKKLGYIADDVIMELKLKDLPKE
jgi:hypothetical protein